MSKDMKLIMESYRKGILLNEIKANPKVDFDGDKKLPGEAEQGKDEVPFDPRVTDIAKLADTWRKHFKNDARISDKGLDPKTKIPIDDDGGNVDKAVAKLYYRGMGIEDFMNPHPNELSRKGFGKGWPDKEYHRTDKAQPEDKKGADAGVINKGIEKGLDSVEGTDYANPADNVVTIGEFMEWFQKREANKSELRKLQDTMAKKINSLAKEYPKYGKHLISFSEYISDMGLRGLLGMVAGDQTKGAEKAIRTVVLTFFQNIAVPSAIAYPVSYIIAKVMAATISQYFADQLEFMADYVKDKLGNINDIVMRDTFPLDQPVLQQLFDVPEPILRLMDLEAATDQGNPKAGAQKATGAMIKQFFRDYSGEIARQYEQAAKDKAEGDESVLNRQLELKFESGAENFGQEALLRIKKAIGADSIKVDDVVVESKRRRIVYRGKK